ncbi:hypothetical protein A0J48_024505 [Sphaerospermopsis aphanizomenoides BCCUSP55]|uniref:hypothetical protein n=1 Tax=Sphaerospermopsis aphanizomenoides TaxID=459663 RepID=UPI0019033014|nr:hypothetical protein [Sphaerospermopsis aphanizomenoides]MBK1990644.1 hypothetical protein [Sphaerospermopsis aphanizomenoides BCCUSP55]
MNIAKLIFLACHVFLASLLLVVSPAQAASKFNVVPAVNRIVVTSVQANPKFTVPILTQPHHQIVDQTGCACSACVQSNFHLLQGKLPGAGF